MVCEEFSYIISSAGHKSNAAPAGCFFLFDLLLILTCRNSFPEPVISVRGFRWGEPEEKKRERKNWKSNRQKEKMERIGKETIISLLMFCTLQLETSVAMETNNYMSHGLNEAQIIITGAIKQVRQKLLSLESPAQDLCSQCSGLLILLSNIPNCGSN